MHSSIKFTLLLVLVFGAVGCQLEPAGSGDSSAEAAALAAEPQEALSRARQAFRNKDYQGCLATCNALLRTRLTPVQEARARFWAAEALFADGQYYLAHQHYEVLIAYFPGFSRLRTCIDREYAIGCAFVDGRQERPFLGLSISARDLGYEMLSVLLERFEDSTFDYGRFLMGEYQFEEESYPAALINYQRLIREYPQSEWVDLAYFRTAQATLRLCEGYHYDVDMALRAEALLVDYQRRFPRGNKIGEAEALLAEVRSQLAQRNLRIAWYYRERAGEPLAAAIYLSQVIERYQDTSEAEEARSLLRALVAAHPEREDIAAEEMRIANLGAQ